ncbi:MAG: PAS domain-containing protein [Lentisphaerae bacterium]|nr:PAS domain-containing protein [Lentisphaerota bacterium]
MKTGFLDKLIERLGKLDSASLQEQFLRLIQERGLLESVFNALHEGIIILDGQGYINYANNAAATLLGFDLQKAARQSIARILKSRSERDKDIEWDRLLNPDEKTPSELISREIEITYPLRKILSFYVMPLALVAENRRRTPRDAGQAPDLSRVARDDRRRTTDDGPQKADDGRQTPRDAGQAPDLSRSERDAGPEKPDQPGGAVIILRDITGAREKEMRVLTSERQNALTVLAAGVAHEIGNPLNSLHIHLQLLKRELQGLPPETSAACRDLVDVASKEVERLNLIITQFLRAIRPRAPRLEAGRIDELLQETLTFMRPEIENRDVLVEVKCPNPLPQISVDRDQIKQVFFNVIKNALQAMTRGGLLTVTLSSNDHYLGLAFKDTGAGIAPEDLSRLFEPFHSTRPEGTGLGLIIVQRIIQDHGGKIEVHSRPGAGLTFTILLPLDQRRIRLLKAPRRSRSPPNVGYASNPRKSPPQADPPMVETTDYTDFTDMGIKGNPS